MKSCPTCGRTFSDDTLTYCLGDGSLLSAPYEPEATLSLPLSRITSPTKTGVPFQAPAPTPPATPASGAAFKYVVIALLALIAGGGIMAWLNSGAQGPASDNPSVNKSSDGPRAPSSSIPVSSPGSSPARPQLGITATASSERTPESGITYRPGNVVDQSLATAWDEGVDGDGVGEWIRLDFEREVRLNRIIITPGYFKTPSIWRQNNRLAGATFYFSDGSSRHFTFPDRMAEQRLDVGGVRTNWVRMVIDEIYPGSADAEDTPISNLAFDWE